MGKMNIWSWPRTLIGLPFPLRLAISLASFLLYAIISSYLHVQMQNDNIIMLPLIITIYFFKQKGMIICTGGFLALTCVENSVLYHGLDWPLSALYHVAETTAIMLLIGISVLALRMMIEDTENILFAAATANTKSREEMKVEEQQQQLDQIKTQFIMNVNHELRTPVTAAYGYFELLQLMLEQSDIPEKALFSTYLGNALNYCDDLCNMVNNVLETIDIWNIQQPVRLQECMLMATIQILFTQVKSFKKEKKRILLAIPNALTIQAHPQYLYNILYQLISNAIKFSPEGSPIIIYPTRTDENVSIIVQDFGPGIPPAEIQGLFHPFTRLQRDIAGKIRGTGQGLHISKLLVEAMQGQIWIESTGEPGKGCRQCFTLCGRIQDLRPDNGRKAIVCSHSDAHPLTQNESRRQPEPLLVLSDESE